MGCLQGRLRDGVGAVRAGHGDEQDPAREDRSPPKAMWFGAWISNSAIAATTARYIANAQAGNPNALVQMTVFRMVPWEGDACKRLPTAAEQASYKEWVDRMAGARSGCRRRPRPAAGRAVRAVRARQVPDPVPPDRRLGAEAQRIAAHERVHRGRRGRLARSRRPGWASMPTWLLRSRPGSSTRAAWP